MSNSIRWILVATFGLAAPFLPGRMEGQTFGEVKGFKIAEYYEAPHEGQMKSLLEAAKARRLADGRYLLTDASAQTLRVTGGRDLVVRTPQCVYDQALGSANSAGPLRAETADGGFSIEGEGFRWQQTNSVLTISNRVHTIVQPELLGPGPHNGGGGAPELPPREIEIFSHRFDFTNSSGLAVYRENVRVMGTNLSLTSGKLTIDLPLTNRQLQSITAEQDVIIDYTNTTGVHASGDRAVYGAPTGLIHITGRPAWRADQREGRGDELVIDSTNRVFQANGNAWLKMLVQSAGTFTFSSNSNGPAADPRGTTNRAIQVWSGRYEFSTNWAVFQDDVRLKEFLGDQVRGTVSCGRLTAVMGGTNELQRLIAETNVIIEAEEKRMTGGIAVYTSTNGWLDLTENPTWKADSREGKGNLVRVMTRRDEMLVQGEAFLRLPANELGDPKAVGTAVADPRPVVKPAAVQYAEIACQEYTLRPEIGVFRGGVQACHPQMSWACDRLTVRALPDNGKALFSEGRVIFDLIDDKGQKIHGTGDNVVYTNMITSAITNDILYLRGTPATLETTNAVVYNRVITLDRARNVMSAPGGDYKIKGKITDNDTNMFKLPKSGIRK